MKGRIGIYEVMRMTPRAAAAGRRRARAAEEIHAAAVAGGMVDLKAYAVRLLVQGLTSTDEVTSVVSMGDA